MTVSSLCGFRKVELSMEDSIWIKDLSLSKIPFKMNQSSMWKLNL